MKKGKEMNKKMFIFICVVAFLISFIGSVTFKMTYTPNWTKKFSVDWTDSVGTIHTDIAYGSLESNKFDLYLPSDDTKESYGLVVYLHAGGFTSGDKSDDKEMLQWLCSKGYVSVGINYTLRSEENNASVLSQSNEIKDAMPFVIEAAKELGYTIDEMVISGGSAGGALAMLYAYRDVDTSPVPVKMLFQMVGPSSYYAEDWGIYGLDNNPEAAAELFGVMAGVELTSEMIISKEYEELMTPISSYKFIDKNTAPSLLLYGTHDTMQPYKGVRHLVDALENYNIDFKCFEAPHSGHGVQNDDKVFEQYMDNVVEYLNKYMPIKN